MSTKKKPQATLIGLIGLALLAAGATAIAPSLLAFRIEAVVTAKRELPPVFGTLNQLLVKVPDVKYPRDGWLMFSTGWFGRTTASDLLRFREIREGCRYRFTVWNANPRGGGQYEVLKADLLSCA